MADPTNPTNPDLPDPAKLQAVEQILARIVELAKKLGDVAGDKVDLFPGMEDSVGELKSAFSDLEEDANTIFKNIATVAGKAGDELKKLAQSAFGIDLSEIGIDSDALGEEFENAYRVASGEATKMNGEIQRLLAANRVNLAEMVVFKLGAPLVDELLQPIEKLESQITAQVKGIAPGIVDLGGAFATAGLGSEEFTTRVEEALTNSARSAQQLGMSVEATRASMGSLTAAGIDVSEVFGKMGGDTTATGERMYGLTAAIRLSKATGLEMGKISEYVQLNIRQLGRSASDTSTLFAALSLAQRGTGLSMRNVSESVMGSASQLRYYGTSVESLSNTFNAFVKSVGEGRQELGKELFTDTVRNLHDMNFGLKAFLGMQSQVGQGRGAIGAGLEVEQALAEGRTGEIFTSIREQLEQMGGGEILTRRQALDTGQESQYLLQRQLLQTITGQSDTGKLDTMLGIMQRGEIERSTEVFAGPQALEQGRQQLMEVGQARIDMETGVKQQLVNKMRAEEAEALGKMVSSYQQAANTIRDSARVIFDQVKSSVGKVVVDKSTTRPGAMAAEDADLAAAQQILATPELIIGEGGAAKGSMLRTKLFPSTADVARDTQLLYASTRTVGESQQLPFATGREIEQYNTLPTRSVRQMESAYGLNVGRLQLDYANMGISPAGYAGQGVQTPVLQVPQAPVPPQVESLQTPAVPTPNTPVTTPTPSAPTAPPTATRQGPTALQFEAQQLEIPISFKIDGDSIKAVVSSIKRELRVEIKQSVAT
jgi:hypothetical protein